MRDHDLTAWLDGELDEAEELIWEEELRANPGELPEIGTFLRQQLLLAEVLNELAVEDATRSEARESGIDALPNEEIFTAYIDRQLSESQTREVEQQIESEPLLHQELAQYCRQSYQLAEVLGTESTKIAARRLKFPSPQRVVRTLPSARPSGSSWFRIAAVLAVLATGAWFLSQSLVPNQDGRTEAAIAHTASGKSVATIRESFGEVAIRLNAASEPLLFEQSDESERLNADSPMDLSEGDAVVTGNGSALIAYEDGTLLQLRSNSQLKLGNQNGSKHVLLMRGLAGAEVASQPEGMPLIASTRELEVEVLGTSFFLETFPDQSLLQMTKGSVRVKHLKSGETSTAQVGDWIEADAQGHQLFNSEPRVISLSFIDTETKMPASDLGTIARDGILRLSDVGDRDLSIRVDTAPKHLREARIRLEGPRGFKTITRKEQHYPYLVTRNVLKIDGIDSANYKRLRKIPPGHYTLTAEITAYDGRGTTRVIRFEVKP